MDDQIEIVMDTDELLAVNKPCSIPIHPVSLTDENLKNLNIYFKLK